MNSLIIDDLTIRTSEQTVVHNISLDMDGGEIVALLGETGSGKSLIGSAVMGLTPSGVGASGRLVVNGKEYSVGNQKSLRTLWSEDLFLLPQEPLNALAPLLTAQAQVAEQLTGTGRLNETKRALLRMELSAEHHEKRPFELSGGMAQRVLAAIASVTDAGILIADEPTKGLDADRRETVAQVFRTLKHSGRSILLITHDITLVRMLADRVAFLDDGQIVEFGPTTDTLRAPCTEYARKYIASDPSTWERMPFVPSRTRKVIEVENLRIGFGNHVLADSVNFHCHAGHISALLGRSGIGKSTLGRTLLGLTPPIKGSIKHPSGQNGKSLQKLHQDPTRVFAPAQSIEQSFQDLIRLPGGDLAIRIVPELMERFGLRENLLQRRPNQISGGEAQRLALVRILAMRPKMLIADEPTSRLDPPIQEQVIRHLRKVADDDELAILLITHDRDLALSMADRRMLMTATHQSPAKLVDVTRA